jgi:hypothetical protein
VDAPTWARDEVVAMVDRQFAPEQREQVLAALDAYAGDTPAGRARVQLAVLALANGDAGKVREYIALARSDFRDVLYASGADRGLSVIAPQVRSITTVVAWVTIAFGVALVLLTAALLIPALEMAEAGRRLMFGERFMLATPLGIGGLLLASGGRSGLRSLGAAGSHRVARAILIGAIVLGACATLLALFVVIPGR